MSLFSARSARRLVRAVKPRLDVLEGRALPSCNLVAGYVYIDANNNGVLEPGEQPIGGSAVELRNASGAVIATTTTNSAGHYQFDTDGAGNYTIRQSTQPTGLLDGKESRGAAVLPGSVGSDQIPITLADSNLVNNNFGELAPARIRGSVYADDNASGALNAGESGIVDVAIKLTGVDDTGSAVALELHTTPEGTFVFKGLRPGIYTLTETQPAGWKDGEETLGTQGGTKTNDKFANITLDQGDNARHYRFGEIRPGAISGFVFIDRDDDGLRESGEGGIANVLITLTGIDDRGRTISLQTRTAADGSYGFANLRPGMYLLTEAQPAGFRDGKDTAGSLGGTTANDEVGQIALAPGDAGVEYNFAELPTNVSDPSGGGGKIDYTGTNDPRR